MNIKRIIGSPGKIARTLEMLVNAARRHSKFPIWAFTFRALAYYDQRQTISNLLSELNNVPQNRENSSCGQALVLAEACLECAGSLSIVETMLKDIDAQHCLPLAPNVANLWKHWLLAEYTWWKERKTDRLESFQTQWMDFMQNPPSETDSYSKKEWKRLIARFALLIARCALAQCQTNKAEEWIESASRASAESWEIEYLRGMTAWSHQDYQNARTCLENCLTLNPFQSRVRFELALLMASKNSANPLDFSSLPASGPYDILANTALILFKGGRIEESHHCLQQLDQPEMPYSLFLIWPQARTLRLQQGKELRAYLAEVEGNWPEAIQYWDAARINDRPGNGMTARESPGTNIVERAHRVYLLGRYLEQTEGIPGPDKILFTQFHKELGKLSIRTLTGEAMFYRGLAAEKHMPERAHADWRALLHQSAWLQETQMKAPGRLLFLGDKLLKLGFTREAHKAYRHFHDTSMTDVPERQFFRDLLTQSPPPSGVDTLLKSLEAAGFPPGHSFLLFLRGLCILAQEQPNLAAASSLLKEAQQAGLPAPLERICKILSARMAGQPGSERQLCSFLDEAMPGDFPLKLWVGLEMLSRPKGVESLRHFKEAFGDGWKTWCPLPLEDILGKQLQEYYRQGDYKGALDQIQETENLGLQIPAEWKAFLYMCQAVGTALKGDFATAEKTRQKAINLLSPDLCNVKNCSTEGK